MNECFYEEESSLSPYDVLTVLLTVERHVPDPAVSQVDCGSIDVTVTVFVHVCLSLTLFPHQCLFKTVQFDGVSSVYSTVTSVYSTTTAVIVFNIC